MSEFATGLIERDYSQFPSGYCLAAPSAPDSWIVPENEREERLKEQKANRASLLHLREKYYSILKSLNQGNRPLCWAYSTTKAVMYLLAQSGMPELLSAFWTAGIANGWRNQGGWCTLSLDALKNVGAVPAEACPDFSPKYVTADNKALAAKRRVIEWYDGGENRDRNRDIVISACLLGLPFVGDHNNIGHSMAGCYLESLNPLVIGYDNSWSEIDQYGPKGLWLRKGFDATPDGVIVARVIQPAD
jgi:hypothetical protein